MALASELSTQEVRAMYAAQLRDVYGSQTKWLWRAGIDVDNDDALIEDFEARSRVSPLLRSIPGLRDLPTLPTN